MVIGLGHSKMLRNDNNRFIVERYINLYNEKITRVIDYYEISQELHQKSICKKQDAIQSNSSRFILKVKRDKPRVFEKNAQ